MDSRWYSATPSQRLDQRIPRPGWWGIPAGNALDLATAKLPRLLYERLPEAGLDVSVIYAGVVHHAGLISDGEVRRVACRASNRLHRDVYQEFADRIIPVATIPAHTPGEAIEELEYCVNELGYRAFVMPSYVKRPIPEYRAEFPRVCWFDTYGIDSEYDYDPFWRKCVELKVAPTFHSSSQGMFLRASVTNFTFNHIGHFAEAGAAVCKSIFMGGVTRRFPELRFAFLEGGAAWSATLFADLIGHWKKRNVEALDRVNPAKLDRAAYFDLCRKYGGELVADVMNSGNENRLIAANSIRFDETQVILDEFHRIGMTRVEDMLELFVKPFFFGCEGDDPMNSVAFDRRRNPLHATLQAVFGSDIAHFDVPEIAEVLEESYEPVEKGLMSEEDFRDFVFVHPIRLWTAMNPDFFKGTAVEKEVAEFLADQ